LTSSTLFIDLSRKFIFYSKSRLCKFMSIRKGHVLQKLWNVVFVIFFLNSPVLWAQAGFEGGSYTLPAQQCISAEQAARIKQALIQNQEILMSQHKLDAPIQHTPTLLQWPLRPAVQLKDPSYYGISNFIDHNAAYPDKITDYNCGTRSYDLASGYNHKGIDIFLWPFSQYKQENNLVEVVAAAAGTIIGKDNGNFDKNCAMCTNCPWNAIYIRHADGSVAWYGHMKNGSLNSKQPGETVVQGEKLGIVGSSGSSTGPHLHFEVYANAQQTQLVDPFAGPCNALNGATSWWQNQKPYREPTINSIQTHSAPPVFPSCPALETLNERNVFSFSDPVYFIAYLHDQQTGQQASWEIIKPSGSLFTSWTQTYNQTYDASWWYWWYNGANLPAEEGYWKFRVTYLATGQTVTHTFYRGVQPPVTSIKHGNWHDASTWSNNQIPSASTHVFVQHRVLVQSNAGCKMLRVSEKGQIIAQPGVSVNIITP
jgi:murein DD-endopeptidase MepM/ murein hydrolase activator NlpD